MFAIPDELGLDPLTEEQLAEAQAIVAAEKASGEFDELYATDRSGPGPRDRDERQQPRAATARCPTTSTPIEHIFADFGEIVPLFEHLGRYLRHASPRRLARTDQQSRNA